MLSHAFCAHLDARALEARRLPVPFVPTVRDVYDTSNFGAYPGEEERTSRKYERFLDAQYDALWEREFA